MDIRPMTDLETRLMTRLVEEGVAWQDEDGDYDVDRMLAALGSGLDEFAAAMTDLEGRDTK